MVISEVVALAISNLLDEIIERASKLRERGVRVVDIKGDIECRIEIDPAEPTLTPAMVADALVAADREPTTDPLDDPETYGRTRGTPGFDTTDIDDRDY